MLTNLDKLANALGYTRAEENTIDTDDKAICNELNKLNCIDEAAVFADGHSDNKVFFIEPNGTIAKQYKLRYRKEKYLSYPSKTHFLLSSNNRKPYQGKTPNQFSKINERAINNWIEYLNAQYVFWTQDKERHDKVNEELTQEIETFINSVQDAMVYKFDNITEVRTNKFTVKFTHDKRSEYLSHRVIFEGLLADITTLENLLITNQ